VTANHPGGEAFNGWFLVTGEQELAAHEVQ